MGNAIWLFWMVPVDYFWTIVSPFSTDLLTIVPVLGVLSLAIGVVVGIAKREKRLLLFLLLVAASQILLVAAGFARGAFKHDPSPGTPWIIWIFLLLQVAGAAYLVWRLKGARVPAAAMGVFTSSYGFIAAFVASMALADDWI
jgi:uncharacterized membrane protein HdeD (DUF308 family)